MKLFVKVMLGFLLMSSFSAALLADKDWGPCGDRKSNTQPIEVFTAF